MLCICNQDTGITMQCIQVQCLQECFERSTTQKYCIAGSSTVTIQLDNMLYNTSLQKYPGTRDKPIFDKMQICSTCMKCLDSKILEIMKPYSILRHTLLPSHFLFLDGTQYCPTSFIMTLCGRQERNGVAKKKRGHPCGINTVNRLCPAQHNKSIDAH